MAKGSKVNTKKGQVIKAVGGRFIVKSAGVLHKAHARGRIRLEQEIYVGDFVEFEDCKPFAIIESVEPRKTVLTRPYVANVETAIIVVAKEPVPDLLLVDKVIINCFAEGITPILCYNKSDLATKEEIAELFKQYENTVECFAISSLTGEGMEKFEPIIRGKTVTLAGQSAVGKSSLLNTLLGLKLETGELSDKIARGKNTTRHIEILDAFGGQILDTCGFSMLELMNIEARELRLYYDDFCELQSQCEYRGCEHINEPNCAVKKAVEGGKMTAERYERYKTIYQELKEKESKRYD